LADCACWLVLICCKRKILLFGWCWWLMLIRYERKTLFTGWLTSQPNRVVLVADVDLIELG